MDELKKEVDMVSGSEYGGLLWIVVPLSEGQSDPLC